MVIMMSLLNGKDHILTQYKLDSHSPVPFYHQLKRILKGMIEAGKLKPGGLFWTDKQLSELFKISRTTVREAIRELTREGYLLVHQGKRTYIAKSKVIQGLPGFSSFSEDMRRRGLVPGSKLISFDIMAPPPEICRKLRMKYGQKAARLKRQMLANGSPIGYHVAFLPVNIWKKLGIKPRFLEDHSLYQTLEEKGGLILVEADESIEVTYADKEVADMLLINKGEPMLTLNRVVFSPNGVPVEYTASMYPSGRFRYEIRHLRQSQQKVPY